MQTEGEQLRFPLPLFLLESSTAKHFSRHVIQPLDDGNGHVNVKCNVQRDGRQFKLE